MSTMDREQALASYTRQAVSIQIEMLTAVEDTLLDRISRCPEEYETLSVTFQVSRIQSDALKHWLVEEEDGHHDRRQLVVVEDVSQILDDQLTRIEDEPSYDELITNWLQEKNFIVQIKRDEYHSGLIWLEWNPKTQTWIEVLFQGWWDDYKFAPIWSDLEKEGCVKFDWSILPTNVAEHIATRVAPSEWHSRLIDGEKAYTDLVKIWVKK